MANGAKAKSQGVIQVKKLAIMIFAGLIASAMTLAHGSISYAHGPHHGGGYHYYQGSVPPQAPQMTQAQMEKAQQIYENSSGKIDNLMQSLASKQNELNAELAKSSPSNDKVLKLSSEIGEIRGRLIAEHNAIRAQLAKEGIPAPAPGQVPGPGNYYSGYPGMPCPGAGPCWGGYMHGPRHGWGW